VLQEDKATAWGRQRANELRSYLDPKKRPSVHLLDGGLSDNIGMREVLENTAYIGGLESTFRSLGAKKIRKLVYLMVSAETTPDPSEYMLNEIPGLMRVSRALVDIPINRYSTDTAELMRQSVAQWRRELRQRPPGDESVFTADADIYFINASLMAVTDPEEEARLMNIPTNLSLTDERRNSSRTTKTTNASSATSPPTPQLRRQRSSSSFLLAIARQGTGRQTLLKPPICVECSHQELRRRLGPRSRHAP